MPSCGLFCLAALLIASGNVTATISKEFSALMDNLYFYDSLFPYPKDEAAWKISKQNLLNWYDSVKEIQRDFGNTIGLHSTEEQMSNLMSKVNKAKSSLDEIFSPFQLSKGPVKHLKNNLTGELTKYADHMTDTFKELSERIVQLRVVTAEPWTYDLGDQLSPEYYQYKQLTDTEFTAAFNSIRKPAILGVNTIRFQKVKESTLALVEIKVTSTANLGKAIVGAMTVDGNTTMLGSIEVDPKTLTLEVVPPEQFIIKVETFVKFNRNFADSASKEYTDLEDDIIDRVNYILKYPFYGRTDTFLHAKLDKIVRGKDDMAVLEIIVSCRNKYDQSRRDIYNSLYRAFQRDRLGTTYLGNTMIRDNMQILGEAQIALMLEQQELTRKSVESYDKQDEVRASYFTFITIPFVIAILILVFTFMMCVNFRHCCCDLCAPKMGREVSYKSMSSD